MHMASENSHRLNDPKLSDGHGPPPSVVEPVHLPVRKLHGPSPTVSFGPSIPPLHVWNVFGSNGSSGLSLTASGFETLAHGSKWPSSVCIRTPPSSAAHGTWFPICAVSYS